MTFVVGELQDKCPKEGEEAKLSDLRYNLQQNSKRQNLVKDLREAFSNSNIYNNLFAMQKMIDRNAKDESFDEVAKNLEQVHIYLQEVEESIDKLGSNYINDNLEEVESRLFEIRDLSRKYHLASDELPGFFDSNVRMNYQISRSKIDNTELLSNHLLKLKRRIFDTCQQLCLTRGK
ncbi:MAG UNVERIFIED_CONTAM: hypothetical protein LVQ98_00575 [Rickettsiaceae bacterium]